jgi:glucose/arabinose dehydrogenase
MGVGDAGEEIGRARAERRHRDGRPTGQPVDILTGFLGEEGDARGRPVGVALDKQGGLLVADDVGNAIWRVGTATR